MERRPKLLGYVLGAFMLAGLVALSIHLAVHRIYQVDEAQTVYSARIVALGSTSEFYTNGSLALIGPLAWVTRLGGSSVAMFTGSRLLFTALFWLNIFLIPFAMGFRAKEPGFWCAMLGAATLAPLWDYGFEVRHDNLMLALLLLLWITVRNRALSPRTAIAIVGSIAAVLQAVAFKSFLYWVPMTLCAFAILRPPEGARKRSRLGAVWVSGFILSTLALMGLYHATGLWGSFREGLSLALSVSGSAARLSPGPSLSRLLEQTPLLVALVLASFVVTWADWRRRGADALGREGPLPDLLLVVVALGALLSNPTPFPYNLVLLVPFMLLPLRRASIPLRSLAPAWSGSGPLAALLVTLHIAPFVGAVLRHLEWTNDRQHELMRLAESLTDPALDRVYDGVGLVPTRRSIGRYWFLHSLYIPMVRTGAMPSPAVMLASRPASVILRSYRTDWFSPEDVEFVNAHYVGLSDEVLVLGRAFPPGASSFDCIHAGTYSVVLRGDAPPRSGDEVVVDGRPHPFGSRVRLEKGIHRLETSPASPLLVLWTGPRSDLPVLGPGDHRKLFVNWY